MRIAAFIPIKLTNERLPGKNTMLLGGKPLIQYQQEELLKVKSELDTISVFCSDESIQSFLLEGISFVRRPTSLDKSTTKGNEIYSEFIKTIDADFYLLDHATAPYVQAKSIANMINAVKTGLYDSSFAAYGIQKFLWCNGEPLNFDIGNVPRTQDLPPVFVDQCGPYLFSKELFVRHHRRVGFNPYIQRLDFRESIDIDTVEDFELASKYA